MNNYIIGNSTDEITYKTLDVLVNNGRLIESRVAPCYELDDVDLFLLNPKRRLLDLKGRKNNPVASIFELIWVMSGNTEIRLLKEFLPRASDYSDDGISWYGGYGGRIHLGEQLQNVINKFSNDLYTRQGVMTIWNPLKDTEESHKRHNIPKNGKDYPCTIALNFLVRDGKLNLKTNMRSNDILWGLSHINVLEFTFLQELVKDILCNLGYSVDLGYYHHSVMSLHSYDYNSGQADVILKNNNLKEIDLKNSSLSNNDLGFKGTSINDFKSIMNNIYDTYSNFYNEHISSLDSLRNEMKKYFKLDSIMFDYLKVIEIFKSKNYNEVNSLKDQFTKNVIINYYKRRNLL